MPENLRVQEGCTHRILAHGHKHQISVCSCGTVHLTVANTTLRLSRAEFNAIVNSALLAQRDLEYDCAATPSLPH